MAKLNTIYSRVFSPRVITRAIRAFDRATVVIVASTWGGVVLLMLFALYTLNLSTRAKVETVAAAAMEPALPQMLSRQPDMKEMEEIRNRLEKRFPDVTFAVAPDRAMTLTANDGSKFRMWLNALTYIDTAYPKYRWRIKEMCVGAKCSTNIPMKAVLTPDKIVFANPVSSAP